MGQRVEGEPADPPGVGPPGLRCEEIWDRFLAEAKANGFDHGGQPCNVLNQKKDGVREYRLFACEIGNGDPEAAFVSPAWGGGKD